MRSRTASRTACQRDDIAGLHFLAYDDEKHRIVTIAGDKTATVIDFYEIAVAIDPSGQEAI